MNIHQLVHAGKGGTPELVKNIESHLVRKNPAERRNNFLPKIGIFDSPFEKRFRIPSA